jgi:phosphohistidine phosphatase SixA/protein-S-isoprenylcysteine O-methyltransferase Ste14
VTEVRYYLLCRHGPHRAGQLVRVGEGEYPTAVVGERLREAIRDSSAPAIVVRAAVCAPSDEAWETARRLVRAAKPGCHPRRVDYLHEGSAGPPPGEVLAELDGAMEDGNAILVVGHQPQLSWLADHLLNRSRRLFRQPPTPIDRAGLVAIRTSDGGRGRLLWAISYDDSAVVEQVREKIQRKMDTARLLSGAVTIGLTITLGVLLDGAKLAALGDRAWTVQLSCAALLAAGLLYFATMYAYDSLLMPQRFWGERRPPDRRVPAWRGRWLVARPPSSAAWILYQNMMRIWRNLFTAASVCVGIGIVLLCYGALGLKPWSAIGGGAVILLVVSAWIRWSRPVLGSED